MLETVKAVQDTFAKKRAALSESISLDDVLTTRDLVVNQEPFPHIVADNVFKPEFYARIEQSFASVRGRGLSEEADASRFKPFLELKKKGKEWEYDGYVYVPSPSKDAALASLYSLEWNLLFSRLFNQPTDWTTSVAFHHHPPGNRTGFIHNDYAPKLFSTRNMLPNAVIHTEQPAPGGADASVFRTMRVIALLIYLGNEPWQEGDGGGTGLYAGKGMLPAMVVEPRRNRLLAFQISPKSFHAFQENKTERNSITQWFHMNSAWCGRTYGHL